MIYQTTQCHFSEDSNLQESVCVLMSMRWSQLLEAQCIHVSSSEASLCVPFANCMYNYRKSALKCLFQTYVGTFIHKCVDGYDCGDVTKL
jgi:hypothetical protein